MLLIASWASRTQPPTLLRRRLSVPTRTWGASRRKLQGVVAAHCDQRLLRRIAPPQAETVSIFGSAGRRRRRARRSIRQPTTRKPRRLRAAHGIAAAIEECISLLSDDHRVVAVLSDVQGLSYAEIAESANISTGTVKSRLSRARARLRDCLQASKELLPAGYRLNNEESG